MTKKIQRWHKLAKLPLVAAIAASVSTPVHAFQFYLGEIEGSLDTTLSAGASWRVAKRDTNQLAQGNIAPGLKGSTVGSSTNNADDGNWNFKRGETFSKIVKGTSDLSLSYDNYGAFVRGRYFYDFELMDEGRAKDNNGISRPLNKKALDQAGADIELMDAYVYGDFEIGDMPLNARLGRQVVSWGESTFIQGGINTINPADVSALRAPGAEIKDILLPVNMVYASLGVTTDISIEAFYQLEWEKTEIDPCGTFFSTLDFVADGCGPVLLAGQNPDWEAYESGLYVARLGDREPDDKGQYGIAVRWFTPGGTEFGFYHINYHSRLPVVSGIVATGPKDMPEYFIEFPEDIKLYGISFSTTADSLGLSIGGEVSHRRGTPLSWNPFELIYGGVEGYQAMSKLYKARTGGAAPGALRGQEAQGWDRYNVTQAQVTFIRFFEQIMGASRLSFVGEVGATYVHDLPGLDEAVYGRSSAFGIGYFEPVAGMSCETINNNPKFCTKEGFTTSFSWGYRARFALDYNDVFAGVNLTPMLSWSHDVKGYAPEPGGAFVEGAKSVGLSVRAEYMNQYTAEVGYTNFFGGKPYNLMNDRDFVSASVSVSF